MAKEKKFITCDGNEAAAHVSYMFSEQRIESMMNIFFEIIHWIHFLKNLWHKFFLVSHYLIK